MKTIRIDQIALEVSPFVRVQNDPEAIAEYTELYRAGKELPEPVLFQDADGVLRLADGRHRLAAAMACGWDAIKCEVRSGGHSEALQFALSANSQHGLRRTNADKRLCVTMALKEWPKFSDRKLGEICAVDHKTVGSIRAELYPVVKKNGESPHEKSDDVGTKIEKENKPMPARKIVDAPIEHVTPPPPPVAAPIPVITMRPVSVPQSVRQTIDEIVRDGMRLPYHDAPFLHFLSKLMALQKAIQLELPGMVEACPPKDKGKGTQQEVTTFCISIGLPASDGDWFYYKARGCGWKNNGKAIIDWQDTCRAWKLANVFPSQKPARGVNGVPTPATKPKGWTIDKEIARAKKEGLYDR